MNFPCLNFPSIEITDVLICEYIDDNDIGIDVKDAKFGFKFLT